MDIEHWHKLYNIDWTAIYLAPEEKWDEICCIVVSGMGIPYKFSVAELKNKSMYPSMSRKQILEQLWPKALELLKDPSYDLK